jgi:hypothetical protein
LIIKEKRGINSIISLFNEVKPDQKEYYKKKYAKIILILNKFYSITTKR